MTKQFKTLIDVSYTAIQIEFEDHLAQGWRMDRGNLPAAYPMRFYEIHLVRDEHREAVKDVFDSSDSVLGTIVEAPKKAAGRPPKVKQ